MVRRWWRGVTEKWRDRQRMTERWQKWQRMRWKVTRVLAYNSISPLGPNPEVHAQDGWHIKDDEFFFFCLWTSTEIFFPLSLTTTNHYHYDQQGHRGEARSSTGSTMKGRGRGGEGRRRNVEGVGSSTGGGWTTSIGGSTTSRGGTTTSWGGGRTMSRGRMTAGSSWTMSRGAGKETVGGWQVGSRFE